MLWFPSLLFSLFLDCRYHYDRYILSDISLGLNTTLSGLIGFNSPYIFRDTVCLLFLLLFLTMGCIFLAIGDATGPIFEKQTALFVETAKEYAGLTVSLSMMARISGNHTLYYEAINYNTWHSYPSFAELDVILVRCIIKINPWLFTSWISWRIRRKCFQNPCWNSILLIPVIPILQTAIMRKGICCRNIHFLGACISGCLLYMDFVKASRITPSAFRHDFIELALSNTSLFFMASSTLLSISRK